MNRCVMCKRPEGPMRMGAFYDGLGENGMRLVHFWVCNECALPLGPRQGMEATFEGFED